MDATLSNKLDQMKTLFIAIEKKFYEQDLIIRASVLLKTSPDVGSKVEHRLAYGQLSNRYRLIVERWENGKRDQTPVENASFELRMLVPDKLEELFIALKQEIVRKTEAAEVQLGKTESFLMALEELPPVKKSIPAVSSDGNPCTCPSCVILQETK